MTSDYPLGAKFGFVHRLADSWQDLSDLLEIPAYERGRFPRGNEARGIWDWLEARDGLGRLGPALAALDRADLAWLLDADRPQRPEQAGDEPSAGARRGSGWRLADDPGLDTFWLPRARGVEPGDDDDGWRFRGRGAAVTRIVGHLTGAAVRPAPLVVLGEPGCGKSALLAHVLVLADPQLRMKMPRRYRTAGTARLIGAVDVAVRATRKTLESVGVELANAARLRFTDVEHLVIALQEREQWLRVVVDGLDEAEPGHVGPIAAMLRKLSLSRRIRVVVGLRRAPARTSLDEVRRVALAATPETTLEADRAPYLELDDVMDLVRDRLRGNGRGPRSPYAGEPRLIERVAGAVTTRSRGNFLVAQITSRNLATDLAPVEVGGRRWWAVFPTDVEGAMDQYIARLGDEDRQREIRDLLMPLAFALGDGLPDGDVWATAATALSRPGHAYSIGDAHRVLEDAATYLVAHVEGGRRTYRLFHDALAQYLRSRCPWPDPATHLVQAWRDTVPKRNERPHWPNADGYLIEHLAQHATGTDELDRLIRDPLFVVCADPVALVPALAGAVSPAARRVARAYRQLPVVAGRPGQRAARLTLSAQQLGDEELRERFATSGPALPWRVTGGAWRPPDDHAVLVWLEPGTRATALLPRQDGSALLVSGDANGRLRVRELIDGNAYPPSSFEVHEPGVPVVSLAGGGAAEDGRHLLCSAGGDGSLRLWHLDAGLLVPLGAEVQPTRGRPLDLAVAGSAVAVCDVAGHVRLIAVGADGQVTSADGVLPGARRVGLYFGDDGPVVMGGTVGGAVVELRPVERDGLAARPVPDTGRWTVGAITTAPFAGGVLVAFGTGNRELHLLASNGGPASPLGTATDVAYAGISSLAVVPASPGSQGGLLLGDHAGWVRFWGFDDAGDLVPRRIGRPHLGEVTALSAVSTPAGPAGVSCDADGKVATWPLEGGESDGGTYQPDVDLAAAGAWSLVLRGGREVECWSLTADDRVALEASLAPSDGAVLGTVDRSGHARAFRSDLADRPTGQGGRRRPVALHPYRAFAVGAGDEGEPLALALRGDGVLEAYSRDLALRPDAARTGTDTAVSVSLGPGPGRAPVVTWGDTEGAARMRLWSQRTEDWRGTPAWPLGRGDLRTASVGNALLTGDGSGTVRLWSLDGGEPRPRTSGTLAHDGPVTAVALDGDEFAVSGDRHGTLLVTPIAGGRLGAAAAYRIELGATVLSVARVGRHKVLVWCRPGAVVVTWDPATDASE